MIGNKIANENTKITQQNISERVESETETSKERYMSPEKRQKVINDLRWV